MLGDSSTIKTRAEQVTYTEVGNGGKKRKILATKTKNASQENLGGHIFLGTSVTPAGKATGSKKIVFAVK